MRTPLLLYGLALAVRGLLIWHFPYPAYPDAAYYVDVAHALHSGQGFNVDFIWIFAEVGGSIPADPVLPIPSNAHWMPLASIVQLPFMTLFGTVAWASAAPFALIGAIAAPLTWAIARDAKASSTVAVGAGILTAIPLLSAVYLVQPDNFSLYQPLVIGSLWMGARALRGRNAGRAFVAAGLLAGLATLSRNDGMLVLASLGVIFLFDRWRAWRSAGSTTPAIPFWAAVSCVAVFVLVMAPWWLRQLAVFGSLSPSTASGKVLFIRDIGEWNSITTPANLDHLLGMGVGPLLASRILGLVAALTIYITLVAGVVLAPFMLIGGWARRHSDDMRPFFVYAAILFAFSAIVSAVHVPGGTFIHSAVALAPYSYILALEGVAVGVGWVASRRRTWDAAAATRIFTTAVVGFAVICAVFGTLVVHTVWDQRRERGVAVAAALDAAGAPLSDRVMSIDAASTKYWSGRGGVVLVNDPVDTVHEVATAYGIRWLVLDRDESSPVAGPILAGDRPSWVGPPIAQFDADDAGMLVPTSSDPDLAVYPVCTMPGDDRCGGRPVTRREAILSALAVFLVALVTRAVFATQIVFPKPEDTAYYVDVARNLIERHALVSDAIWSFQTPPLSFPRPAFEVWLPLPTFLAAIPMAIGGVTFAAAQVSSVVVGAFVPVLAWRLAADVAIERGLPTGRARTLAIGTGLTTAVYLPLVLHSALPDSTMPFTVLALTACLLMSRIARDPREGRLSDPRLIGLGLVIGLTALTRNEALWLGLAWAIVAWRAGEPRPSRAVRARLIGVAGVIAFLVFAPWMVRDWIEFGSPLPGQAATNALSVTGFDIFAWNDPPTVSRYLAVGPARLVEMRVEGFTHNLFSVLVLPGLPISIIGLLALPWQWRGAALRPLVLVSAITFLVTTLVFPVSTTWGTFLHASGPIDVLIVLAALLALDAGIARLGARLGWTRPVAWLGPLLGVFGSLLFSLTLLPSFASGTENSATMYAELGRRMALAGEPLDADTGPVIANFPIWMAWAERVESLALPNETPEDVLDLAEAFPGTRLLVIVGDDHGDWPAVLDTNAPGTECFTPVDLGPPAPGVTPDPLKGVRVYVIGCP